MIKKYIVKVNIPKLSLIVNGMQVRSPFKAIVSENEANKIRLYLMANQLKPQKDFEIYEQNYYKKENIKIKNKIVDEKENPLELTFLQRLMNKE